MKPMLARTYGPRFDRFPCYVQPKLNGVRALYQAGTFQSRDEKLWKPNVLRHLTDQLLPHFGTETPILDGELYVHGWRLQRINGAVAVNRNSPCEDTDKVEFHVFDIVQPGVSFMQRCIELQQMFVGKDLPNIKLVPTATCDSRETLDIHFHALTAQGYEGVMLRPNGPYEYGETPHGTTKRSEYLWKYKSWEDAEFRCLGVTQGQGKADIGIGALTLCSVDPIVLGNRIGKTVSSDIPTFACGTGFDDSERIEYMKNPPIGKLVKVRYLCLSADGIPLNPSFLAVLS
jgi:ATP-dependent DNA ligase